MIKEQPNLFIVGAAKGGTTTIYNQLAQHPEIYLSDPKEPCFMAYFDNDISGKHDHAILDKEQYFELFSSKKAKSCKYRGEASAIYLHLFEKTVANIKSLIGNLKEVKIIMILRDPAERAYSQFQMHRRDLREPLEFGDALLEENSRKANGFNIDYFYRERGLYYNQVKWYLENFDNVKILFYDDLKSSPKALFEEIFAFLELDRIDIQTQKKYNVSGEPKSRKLMELKQKILYQNNFAKSISQKILPKNVRRLVSKKMNESVNKLNTKKTSKPSELIKKLRIEYRPDVEKLENLLGTNLNNWK
jgi:hypothetical protein